MFRFSKPMASRLLPCCPMPNTGPCANWPTTPTMPPRYCVLPSATRRAKSKQYPIEVVDRLLAGDSPLRVWREHRGMTAAQLAAAADVTPAHISKLESGKGEPSVALLKKLAKVLAVQLEELAGEAKES